MKKFFIMLVLVTVLVTSVNTLFAASISDFWNSANSFMNQGSSNSIGKALSDALNPVISLLKDLLGVIGNAIFFIATIFLGVKYMFSAADAKASVKESFVTLLVAATFFYCAEAVTSFSTSSIKAIFNSNTLEGATGNIFETVAFIGQMLAFAAAIFLGIKYMASSADAKADIKKGLFPFVLGIALVFATSTVLKFIASTMQTGLS